MLIKRQDMIKILELINSLSDKRFDIKTQYKLLKIKKAIADEFEIYQQQLMNNCSEFFQRDEKGNLITDNCGGLKVIQEKVQECNQSIGELLNMRVQIPDVYFTIDELEKLNLTLEELNSLIDFIK